MSLMEVVLLGREFGIWKVVGQGRMRYGEGRVVDVQCMHCFAVVERRLGELRKKALNGTATRHRDCAVRLTKPPVFRPAPEVGQVWELNTERGGRLRMEIEYLDGQNARCVAQGPATRRVFVMPLSVLRKGQRAAHVVSDG